MTYNIFVSPIAENDIIRHKKDGQVKIVKKIDQLFSDIENNPFKGIGKPEQLKWYKLSRGSLEMWSRRIDKKHRLIYEVNRESGMVKLLSAYGHYNDK